MFGEIEDAVQSSETESGTVADQRPAGHVAPDDTLQQQLCSTMARQNQILSKFSNNGNRIDRNFKGLKACIATETKQVYEDFFMELAQVNKRLEDLERATPDQTPFEPDTTVVIAKLPRLASEETEAQLIDKVQCVISEGLSLPGVEVIAVTRRATRENHPGLVLAEFPRLLRLLGMNFQTLLDHIDLTRHFRFIRSCHLVPQDQPAASY